MDKKITDKIDQARTENLSEGKKFSLDQIPIKKFYDQAIYIEKMLLPAIEKKSGKQSADYLFFTDVYKSLLYGALIVDRVNDMALKNQRLMQLNKIYQADILMLEKSILKYTTMEDLYLTSGLDKIAADIARKVEIMLTEKK